MAERVKRDYRSDLRATQAAQTKRSVVAAATESFIAVGYAATTIDAIAAAAGVSRKTVFTAVGGKVDLLKLALDWAIAGDDGDAALQERPRLKLVLAHDDPEVLLTEWAALLTEIDVRVAGVFRAVEVAAEIDADARRLLVDSQQHRLDGAKVVVKRLTALRALNRHVSRTEAVDIAWLATDPALYDRLVRVRGWSTNRFAAWLGRMLVVQLLVQK
jgi:AcrR family transcriptional regulator